MKHEPLAHRMRPGHIDSISGQQHLVGKNAPIRRMIEMNQISSVILSGPPGTGKTTIAEVMALMTDLPFRKLNAVSATKKDVQKVAEESEEENTSIVVYLSEIDHFTKKQSEALLPLMEDGSIIIIGSTTESVYHSMDPAILSRSTIFETKPLSTEDVEFQLKRALNDKENGYGNYDIKASDDVLHQIARSTGGDVRSALTILENIFVTFLSDDQLVIEPYMVDEFATVKHMNLKGESEVYNLISALQKSIRGSDVDAGMYYLGMLLELGELEMVCRRLKITAYEDFSNINTNLGTHVYNATEVALDVGLKEARIPLSSIVAEMCLTPKSNASFQAINTVLQDIRAGHTYEVPDHIKDNHFKGSKNKGYQYTHDFSDDVVGAYVNQQYLPDELANRNYYQPREIGHEKSFSKINQYIKENQQSN